jgi:5-methyltetrahydropteroyltriglutamate--homocysteine methyltransferase
MKHSLDRILVTHAGSLPRPDALIAAFRDNAPSERIDEALKGAVADVIDEQLRAGVDVVNDGEFGKPSMSAVDYGAWATYLYGRLSGFSFREPNNPGELLQRLFGDSKDRADFRAFYAASFEASANTASRTYKVPVNTGPVTYVGQAAVQRDIANLKSAIADRRVEEAFLSAVFTGVQFDIGEYYKTKEEQAVAIAEAIREEYKAIVDSGLCLQIDDPLLVNEYELRFSMSGDLAGFRKWAEWHIELLNHALRDLPQEKIRYHLCWGSWIGPHSTDLPMRDVADLMLKINASQYSFEAANPQHEHEWRVWETTKLPQGKALIPGVVTHKTSILERPEVVAERIVRFANVVGRENVIAGTDCGLGGRTDPALAWAKLKALSDGARLATEELW